MTTHKRKSVAFALSAFAAIVMAWGPLREILSTGQPADYYAHFPLVPIVSAFVLARRWKRIFRGGSRVSLWGVPIVFAGVCLFVLDRVRQPALIGHTELVVSGAILILAGSFMGLYGPAAFRKALFPFLFLAFLIPLPLTWMDRVIAALVTATTATTALLFQAFGVPFVREGAVFRLPAFGIQVATECSGIRSSLALLVTTVLAGQLFLSRAWKKVFLILAVFPVTVLKNALRILSLYLLSYFVDMGIIEGGFLHRSGGFIFFGLGLSMLAAILWFLKSPRQAWRSVMEVSPPGEIKGLDIGRSTDDNGLRKRSGGI